MAGANALEGMKQAVVGLVMVALIIGALALALNSFRDDMGDQCEAVSGESLQFNTTDANCYLNGTLTTGAYSAAYNATQEGLEGTSNASSYLSTIGTLVGVAALIAIVVGAFYFIQR